MGQPRRKRYLSRKLKVSVKCACQLNYPVVLDIHTLLFVLYCGKDGLWRARAHAIARHSVFAGRLHDKCPLSHSYLNS